MRTLQSKLEAPKPKLRGGKLEQMAGRWLFTTRPADGNAADSAEYANVLSAVAKLGVLSLFGLMGNPRQTQSQHTAHICKTMAYPHVSIYFYLRPSVPKSIPGMCLFSRARVPKRAKAFPTLWRREIGPEKNKRAIETKAHLS